MRSRTEPSSIVKFMVETPRRVSIISPSLMEFGLIPRDHWYQPAWIDEEKAKKGREKMKAENIIFAGPSCSLLFCPMIVPTNSCTDSVP